MVPKSNFFMNKKRIALLFSGQGAQSVGMGRELSGHFPEVAALFSQADAILGYELSRIMWEGPETELTQTRHCQPALFVHGIACWTALKLLAGQVAVYAVAGLSLGEFTAHTVAGSVDFETGLRLVAQRATFMQEACEETVGGMAAMIGGEESAVVQLAHDTRVDVANYNCPGQLVLSGEISRINEAVSRAKEYGVRAAKPLNVAGAYHSRLMNEAGARLGEVLAGAQFHKPNCLVFANVTAAPVYEAADIRRTLEQQVSGSVRWTQTLEALLEQEHCDLFLELGPGGVLAGLLQRTRKGTPCVSVADMAGLTAAVEALHAP
jgi:[acyl-carrier-protein] S-malonyltransferase